MTSVELPPDDFSRIAPVTTTNEIKQLMETAANGEEKAGTMFLGRHHISQCLSYEYNNLIYLFLYLSIYICMSVMLVDTIQLSESAQCQIAVVQWFVRYVHSLTLFTSRVLM